MPLFPTLLALLGCGSSCEIDGPLDYGDASLWLCRGASAPGSCVPPTRVSIAEDGTQTTDRVEAPESPGLACFAVYPTLDLRLGTGLHHDVDDVDRPAEWARVYGGSLRAVCDVYVPVYRQVRIGTYVGPATDRKDTCFESAYTDVLAAFEAFVAAEPDRPFVLFGHSQGGQHLSRLIRERVETDAALRGRMVAAYPLGWVVGTEIGSDVGGSFQTTPVCGTAASTGCVVGLRTFLAGEELPEPGRFVEGEQSVCVNPASPDAPETTAVLASFTIQVDNGLLDRKDPVYDGIDENALVRWPRGFEARCTGEGTARALEVGWIRSDPAPFDLDAFSVTQASGSHIIDVGLTLDDVVADIGRRAAAMP